MGGFRFGREFGRCGNVARNICEQAIQSNDFPRFHFGNPRLFRGTPSPPSLNPAPGAAFTKSACKILSPKGLRVKILKTRQLRRRLRFLHLPLLL